jgi:hypothetical protein
LREDRVTDQGMSALRSRLAYADLGAFDHDRRPSVVIDLFTVGLVARYIAWKLGQSAEATMTHAFVGPVACSIEDPC